MKRVTHTDFTNMNRVPSRLAQNLCRFCRQPLIQKDPPVLIRQERLRATALAALLDSVWKDHERALDTGSVVSVTSAQYPDPAIADGLTCSISPEAGSSPSPRLRAG